MARMAYVDGRRVDWATFIKDFSTVTSHWALLDEFEQETGKSAVDNYEDFFSYLAAIVKKAVTVKKASEMSLDFLLRLSFVEAFFMNVDRDSKEYKAFWRILNETIGSRLPDGEIVGYKKAIAFKSPYSLQYCIVKIRIPEDAKRSKAFGNKCRCDKAFVEDIYWKGRELSDARTYKYDIAQSQRDEDFKYKLGEWVSVDDFDDCPWEECSTGIHFFENEEDAYNYLL